MGFQRGDTTPNASLLPAKLESDSWGRTGEVARLLLTSSEP